MHPYVLIHIDCGLFEGYSLFYLNGINCAESIAVQMIHSVSTDKKQKIAVEWDEECGICRAVSREASVCTKVYTVSETALLCEALTHAFGLDRCGKLSTTEKKRRETIYSLLEGPERIKYVNEMLMDRWVFADKTDKPEKYEDWQGY